MDFQQFIDLVDKIIWPVTVLAGLLFFRKHLGNVISSLGTIKAGTDGIEMTFQSKIDDVQDLIGTGNSGAISKSSEHISILGSRAETPYQQLMEIKDTLNQKIVKKAIEFKIPTDNTSNSALIDKLKEVGAVTLQNARNINALIDLTNSGNPSINQSQVNQVKRIYNAVQL